MNVIEQLNEIQARADAATEGPWTNRKQRELENGSDARWIYPGNIVAADSHQIIVTQTGNTANSEFIAHARTDIPILVAGYRKREAALRAVFDLHKSILYSAKSPSSHVSIYVCEHCIEEHDGAVAYPCPTVRVVLTALGEVV